VSLFSFGYMSDEQELKVNDGLCNVYGMLNQHRGINGSSVYNRVNGTGTGRDPSQYAEVGELVILDHRQKEVLARNSTVIYNLCSRLPEEALAVFTGWDILGEKDVDAKVSEAFTLWLEERFFFEELLSALFQARLYGDGYLIMGLADGQEADLPLDIKRTKDISFFMAKSSFDMQPYNSSTRPEIYTVPIQLDEHREGLSSNFFLHKDRLLTFTGKRLYGNMLRWNAGKNDSVINSVYQAYANWELSNTDARNMLSQHSLFSFGVKGLAGKVSKDADNALFNRFLSITMGMNVAKGLFYDKDMEDAQFISRNYSGLKEIIEMLEQALLAACDLPQYVLLNTTSGTAFSESGMSERLAFDQILQRYIRKEIYPMIRKLTHICSQIKGCPIYGLQNVIPVFSSSIVLSDLEKAELYDKYSVADERYLNAKVLMPEEIRQSRFTQDKFVHTVSLDNVAYAKYQKEQEELRKQQVSEGNAEKPDSKTE
jgi:phage-related protein (TIGR01555 family)